MLRHINKSERTPFLTDGSSNDGDCEERNKNEGDYIYLNRLMKKKELHIYFSIDAVLTYKAFINMPDNEISNKKDQMGRRLES